ncbi:MAG: hypothetical protein ACTSV2_10170 [Candidatus Thorarchaeota archaeon]
MVDMHEKMREQLIEHGKIEPDAELSKREIQKLYMKYQFEFMRASAGKTKAPSRKSRSKPTRPTSKPLELKESTRKKVEPKPRKALKFAIEQLLSFTKGANYCMTVGGDGWVNLRYKKSKDSLYFQVAGNKYIKPLRVDKDEIKKLEKLGIKAEPMSDDIFSTLFDDKPRDIDRIVDIIFEVFNDIYRVPEGSASYITLDLGGKASDEVKAAATKGLAKFLPKRRTKDQFYWDW